MSCAARYEGFRHDDRYHAWHGPPHALMRAGSIALMVLGFMVWWPLGLAVLVFTIGSRKMGCWGHGRWARKMRRMEEAMDRHFAGRAHHASSGNSAFDEYRQETLRRLEDEQRDFQGFLERLRAAKDKAEFDQFMSERRNRPSGPEPEPAQPAG
ncbi:DUF2852 domain-containing protein [Azospirillum sp.]|uniref:DUF2852 domain-containing protein n=1 Tax=Azospirillum sp. TaxID=34012 RepID=UPI003D74DDC1